MDARLSCPSCLATYQDGVPAQRWSPIHILTRPTYVNFVHAMKDANHYAKQPSNSATMAQITHFVKQQPKYRLLKAPLYIKTYEP